mmetsp:Transcript_10441/g.15244  ORF Transcript_10441/g.15244 Transcript_10441/m.15244 type:complete len:86 (-) Transcript_10441:275-532(-)
MTITNYVGVSYFWNGMGCVDHSDVSSFPLGSVWERSSLKSDNTIHGDLTPKSTESVLGQDITYQLSACMCVLVYQEEIVQNKSLK